MTPDRGATTRSPEGARWAPLASALLCGLMLIGLVAGLQRWTDGFERWTFESRRQWQVAQGQLQAPAVALIGSDGAPLPAWAAEPTARAYLVDFIYTRCPSVCLALGTHYQQMQRELQQRPNTAAGVQQLSVSIDRVYDQPPELARYAALQKADSHWWRLAVPASDTDAALRARLRKCAALNSEPTRNMYSPTPSCPQT